MRRRYNCRTVKDAVEATWFQSLCCRRLVTLTAFQKCSQQLCECWQKYVAAEVQCVDGNCMEELLSATRFEKWLLPESFLSCCFCFNGTVDIV
jgi:hypothetical protein